MLVMRDRPRLDLIIIMLSGAVLMGGVLGTVPRPILIWNVTASVPRGLYWVDHRAPKVGNLVATHLPHAVAILADRRHYLPLNVPLIKPVAALPGQTVCRHDIRLFIDKHLVTLAQKHDANGRALPTWTGCSRLQSTEIFLLNPNVATSFDGRYFGPIPTHYILGRVVPLLIFDEDRWRFNRLKSDNYPSQTWNPS